VVGDKVTVTIEIEALKQAEPAGLRERVSARSRRCALPVYANK
jgi:hypothetical protein